MREAPPTLLRFGEFSLDLTRRGLFRGGERIHLTPKPLETTFCSPSRPATPGLSS